MSLSISIASLAKGHHVECKDLEELLEAEAAVRTACKNVTQYLEAAQTFNGSETVIEYDKGEERVQIRQATAPLLAYVPAGTASSVGSGAAATPDGRSRWDDPEFRYNWYIVGGFVVFFVVLALIVR